MRRRTQADSRFRLPSATAAQVIAGQRKINDIVVGTNLPKIPDEMNHNMIYENWNRFLSEYA